MKRFLALLGALVLAPVAGLAQAPPPEASPPSAVDGPGPGSARMDQMREQFQRIRAQARTQMLSVLTPQHRTLLANVVGSLAIAPTPDLDAAAKQLDAALSPNEAQAIVAAAASLRSQQRAAFGAMGRPEAPPPSDAASPPPENPGRVLLRTTVGLALTPPRAPDGRR